MLQHVPCRGDAREEDGAKSGNFLLFFSTGRARILLGARNSGATTWRGGDQVVGAPALRRSGPTTLLRGYRRQAAR
jgi:hypothetical protein